MLQSNLSKRPTKADMEKKVAAWETLNSVLVKTNAEYMSKLHNLLTEKMLKQEELKVKLEQGIGTEQDNAEFLFLGGYVQCLKDLIGVRAK